MTLLNTPRNPHAEYTAATTHAALFDWSGRTHIRVTGPDRIKLLQGFCTNDLKNLPPQHGLEAFVPNVQGKVLGHIFVFVMPDLVWIESVPGCAAALIAHWSKYQIREELEFCDESAQFTSLYLSGPTALDVLTDAGFPVITLAVLQTQRVLIGDLSLDLRRLDLLNQPGYELVVEASRAAELRSRLTQAGAVPAGDDVFQALRIEARFPLYGSDITSDNLAQEVNRTDQAISFSKGCYLGQEPIARIDALGHVNQTLVGLRLERGPVPAPGTLVALPGALDKVVGRITSATLSYADDRPVALAYMRRHFNTPGQDVVVKFGEDAIPAVID